MIYYNPIQYDPIDKPVAYAPRTCFIMTRLGEPVPEVISDIRHHLSEKLKSLSIKEVDASSIVTGRDFLMKIWYQLLSVPIGIGIVEETMSAQTMSNIFYEVGVLQAYGKEALIIKTGKAKIPSDFIRTEYITYDKSFQTRLDKYFESFFALEEYFLTMANQLEKNPLLSIDYLRRAYLISGDEAHKNRIQKFSNALDLAARAKNSVESLFTRI